MNRLLSFVGACVVLVGGLIPPPVEANYYPTSPVGTTAFLQPWDFLQSSPDCLPCDVLGDDLSRHPGWTGLMQEESFVGVFGHTIDLGRSDAAIYLWESSSGAAEDSFLGPDIQLGYWDGFAFFASGSRAQAVYKGTGVRQEGGYGRMVFSSVTPLGDFQISGSPALNAVRISAVGESNGHDQLIALAVTPEPAGWLLVATALMATAVLTRRRSAPTNFARLP